MKIRREADPEGEANIPPARLVGLLNRLPGPYKAVEPLPDSIVGTTLPEGAP